MKILDGKALAEKLRAELKEKIEKKEIKPGLAVVIVGEDPASRIYVRNKIRACEQLGIRSYSYEFSGNVTQNEVEALLDDLSNDKKIDGILLQLPLPSHLDTEKALKHIAFEKDVDGFSEKNLGLLLRNRACVAPCTPLGVMKLLEAAKIELNGKHAVILGRSETVGKPMAMLLLNANATVTVCHSKTKNLAQICQTADILISAVGKAKFVTKEMVKKGAVVVDVGINRDQEGHLCGDVDFEDVKESVSYITPVPGGVGPMTITMLMYNTYLAAYKE